MYKKIVSLALGFICLFSSSVVYATELAENNSGRLKINYILEEGFNTDATVYLYDKENDLNVYSYRISSLDNFEKSYSVPYGDYYIAAMPSSSRGGGGEFVGINKSEIKISDSNSEIVNIILGSQSFVNDNKSLLNSVDEEGNSITGFIKYEEPISDEKNDSTMEDNTQNNITNIENNTENVSSQKDNNLKEVTTKNQKKEVRKMNTLDIIINILVLMAVVICIIVFKTRTSKSNTLQNEYDDETLKRAEEYNKKLQDDSTE